MKIERPHNQTVDRGETRSSKNGYSKASPRMNGSIYWIEVINKAVMDFKELI